MSETIQIGIGTETPADVQARDDAAAAATQRGTEEVAIHHTNKSTGEVVDHKPTGESPVATRPDTVPEKFWDAATGTINTAALLKAQQDGEQYIAELRSGKAKPAETPAETPDATQDKTPEAAPSQQDAVARARTEFSENGSLSAETYTALEASGLSKDMVDGYIQNVNDTSAALTAATYEGAGGEQQFNTMASWAAENMPADQVAAVNTLLASADATVAKQGALQLKAYYESNADRDPTVQIGGNANTTDGSFFKSKHEMTSAMSDPRYARDASFRAEVAQKVARATQHKVDLFS